MDRTTGLAIGVALCAALLAAALLASRSSHSARIADESSRATHLVPGPAIPTMDDGPTTSDPSRSQATTSAVPTSEPELSPPPAAVTPDPYEARYAGLSRQRSMSPAIELGDVRGEQMMRIAEERFASGQYETRAWLRRGEQTPMHSGDGPLIVERVLPDGEYQVVEFAREEYPDHYANKAEQDWVFREADRRE